jgi:hypothetical protein
MKNVTFYLCTKNRINQLIKSLESVRIYSPNSKIIAANASTGEKFEETSKIINSYENVTEVQFPIDPGMAPTYNQVYKMIDTEFAALWTDDVILLRPIDQLIHFFDNPNILLVALPMIDDLSSVTPADSRPWPTDQFGCALWETGSGRCAHYSITRTAAFRTHNVCGNGELNDVTDNFFHRNTRPEQRVWPDDGAYLYHKRYSDETRINCQLVTGKSRLNDKEKQEHAVKLEELLNKGIVF